MVRKIASILAIILITITGSFALTRYGYGRGGVHPDQASETVSSETQTESSHILPGETLSVLIQKAATLAHSPTGARSLSHTQLIPGIT